MEAAIVVTGFGFISPSYEEMSAEAARSGRGPTALRMSPEAALLLQAVTAAVGSGLLKGIDRSTVALSMVADCGAMASYEAFAADIGAGSPRSASFVHAIPSAPVAMVSLAFGFKGPALTLSGETGAAVDALDEAVRWLREASATAVIVGGWRSPSVTAVAERGWVDCAAVAALVETGESASAGERSVLAHYRNGRIESLRPSDASDDERRGWDWLNGLEAPGDA
jgi:3-oxoacyl-(acyl-carrier-protein) synthase